MVVLEYVAHTHITHLKAMLTLQYFLQCCLTMSLLSAGSCHHDSLRQQDDVCGGICCQFVGVCVCVYIIRLGNA